MFQAQAPMTSQQRHGNVIASRAIRGISFEIHLH